jgi:tripartite-type tricarboxylate transporter receptor subunit TctC
MANGISRREVLKSAFALSVAAALPGHGAAAQSWPSRNLKLIVGGAAGSVPDSLARLAAEALSKKLGQPFIVENKAGAGGIVAMQALMQSPPDGYTIGLTTMSQAVFNSYLFTKLSYDPLRDLVPISTLAGSSFVLAAHPSIEAPTLRDLVAQSKKEPGKFLIGIPANGSPPHIAALLLMRETGLSATVVPFRTGPEGLTAVMRGDIQLFIDGPTLIASQAESRAIKAVVVTSYQRQDVLKNVPTIAEAGFPDAVFESWIGLVAPRGTPSDVVDRISRESRSILDGNDYAQKLKQMSFTPKAATSTEFAGLISDEHKRWAPILQAAGLKLD